jgi:hypothetical protein
MGYGASLRLGWTILLLWGCRRPHERRAVAVFTVVVISDLIVAELWALHASVLAAGRMVPTWALQAALLALFAAAFYAGRSRGSVAA